MDSLKTWALVGLGLVCVALGFGLRSAQLDAQKARTELSEYKQEVNAQALARLQEMSRDAVIRQSNNERVADADQKRQDALLRQLANSRRAADGLRDTIAELERRPVPEDSSARAYADEARAARSLLGQCGEEYRAMDQRAKELGVQVMGLQDYVTSVCRPGELHQTPPD